MTPQEKEHIENAIRHIKTATDVDPWAAEIAVESMRKRITPTSVIVENGWMTKNDIAIHLINEIRNIILKNDSWTEDATTAVNEVADMAIKALEEQEWIPRKKRLPKKDGSYLISGKWASGKEIVGECEYAVHDGFFGTALNFDVLAWKNLPEPYKENT
jgi:hypothetical protein